MWGQQVVALNHPGAGGAVAARIAAAAAPDGYTLYIPASSAFVALPGLQANLPLEVPRDFVPVGFVGSQPFFLSVVPSLASQRCRNSSRSRSNGRARSRTLPLGVGRILAARPCSNWVGSSCS